MTKPTSAKPYFRGVSSRGAAPKPAGISPSTAGLMAAGRIPSSPSSPRMP